MSQKNLMNDVLEISYKAMNKYLKMKPSHLTVTA
jgi:hypothetical protein